MGAVGWQIRHRVFGVYQGQCMGLGFWHPMSEMPEQGFCNFPTRKDADEHVAFLCSPACDDPLRAEDLSVEPYDGDQSERLQLLGMAELRAADVKAGNA